MGLFPLRPADHYPGSFFCPTPTVEAHRMTARDEAIEAAMAQTWWRVDRADQIRPFVTAALAAAVPVLLNDLAARIEAERLTDDTGDPEDNGYNCAISDAIRLVRAAAEGWRA